MNVVNLIDFVGDKNGRKDKDTELLYGLNWVKNDLLQSRCRALWKKGDVITLSSGVIEYTIPSDFGLPDKFVAFSNDSDDYELEEGRLIEIQTSPFTASYPNNYAIAGGKLYVGNPTVNRTMYIDPYYFYTVSDYAAASTSTPLLADLYGDSVYVFGMEYWLWHTLEAYDKAQIAMSGQYLPDGSTTPCYMTEKAKILNAHMRREDLIIQSNEIF